jgi:ATP/maltotriose-dependent transcriptional regulator MalT
MLLAQGKVDEAAPLIARALALRTKLDGPEHPGTAGAMTLQARVLVARGRIEEARALAAAARAILVKSLPPDHWKVALAATVEGAALVRLGRYAEAEPLLVASYPRLKDAPIPTVYDDCRQQLVALYTALGRPEQAAAYVAAPSTTVAAPPP